jgi:tetratricopeptide (TPR) repeat protein
VAAVCDLEFDVTTVARVDDRPVVEVLEALDGAIEAALVAATDRRGRYAFAHALVAETIVCALPASRRARLHLQIADVLAERHDAGEVGAGEVARHLRGAGALAGGDRLATWELARPARARELIALAVEQAQRADDAAALAAALNAQRVALWFPHHADGRLAVAGDMITAAEAAGDREAVLQGRNWRVVDLLELGRVREAAAEIDAYEALADAVGLPHFRWYVPLWRGTLALLAGRWVDARQLAERALALARQADVPNGSLFVGIQRHHSLYAQGRVGELDRARLVEGAAASPAAAEWLVNLALIDAETGATEDARRLVSELARDGCSALAMDANWHGACILAVAAVHVADREAGAALYALLEPHARLFPVIARAVACLGSAEYYVGRLAGLLGRHDEAVARLRRAVAENDRAGAWPHAAAALLRLGEALARDGEHGAARDVLQQAAQRAQALDMPTRAADARRLLDAPVA